LDSESPLNLQNNKYNNINNKFSMAAATTKKKAPILAQIRRLKREEVARKKIFFQKNFLGLFLLSKI